MRQCRAGPWTRSNQSPESFEHERFTIAMHPGGSPFPIKASWVTQPACCFAVITGAAVLVLSICSRNRCPASQTGDEPTQDGHGVLRIRPVLLRHSSPPHDEELDGKIDPAGFHHTGEGAEVAARVLDPALPAVPGYVVFIELQDVDHCDRGSDGTVPLIGPRVLGRWGRLRLAWRQPA